MVQYINWLSYFLVKLINKIGTTDFIKIKLPRIILIAKNLISLQHVTGYFANDVYKFVITHSIDTTTDVKLQP